MNKSAFKRTVSTAGIGLLAIAALVAWLLRAPGGTAGGRIDTPLPAFELSVLDQPERTLSSQAIRGEVTVLNVWASWCITCRVEHPLLMRLAKDEGLRLYGLNHRDTEQDALRWLAYFGDPYSLNLRDGDGAVGTALGLYGVPETYVIDRDGNVRHRHVGALSEQEWRGTIAPLIRQLEKGH